MFKGDFDFSLPKDDDPAPVIELLNKILGTFSPRSHTIDVCLLNMEPEEQ